MTPLVPFAERRKINMNVSEMLKDEVKKGLQEIVSFRIGESPSRLSNVFACELTWFTDIEKQLEYIVDDCWRLLTELLLENELYSKIFFEKVKYKYGIEVSNKDDRRRYIGNGFYSTYKSRFEDAFWDCKQIVFSIYSDEVRNPIIDELRNYDLEELPDHKWPRGRDFIECLERFSEQSMDLYEFETAIDIFWSQNDFI